jgi:hypothetical protein
MCGNMETALLMAEAEENAVKQVTGHTTIFILSSS